MRRGSVSPETRIFRSVDVRLEPVRRRTACVMSSSICRNEPTSTRNTACATRPQATARSAAHHRNRTPACRLEAPLEFVNPFGWAARYRSMALYGAERRLLGGRYESATFFGRRWETQVFLFDDTDRVEDIEVARRACQGVTFQQTKRWRMTLDGRRLHDRLRLQWGYTYKWIRYRDARDRRHARRLSRRTDPVADQRFARQRDRSASRRCSGRSAPRPRSRRSVPTSTTSRCSVRSSSTRR